MITSESDDTLSMLDSGKNLSDADPLSSDSAVLKMNKKKTAIIDVITTQKDDLISPSVRWTKYREFPFFMLLHISLVIAIS